MADGFIYNAPFEAQFDPTRQQEFIILKLLRSMHTMTLVKVLAVMPTSGKVGFLDAQPLVLEQDTNGTVIPQTPIYNIPYLRYQGGSSAVILDPAIDDIGLAVFAERDIRNVKANAAEAPTASDRVYNSADGIYIGGVLNPDPVQYVKFKPEAAGIDVVTPGDLFARVGGSATVDVEGDVTADIQGAVTAAIGSDLSATVGGAASLTAASITLNGPVTINGTLTTTGNITAPDVILPSANLNSHKHGGVQTGTGNTGTPHN